MRTLRRRLRILINSSTTAWPFVRFLLAVMFAVGFGAWGLSKVPHNTAPRQDHPGYAPILLAASSDPHTTVTFGDVVTTRQMISASGTVTVSNPSGAQVFIEIDNVVFSDLETAKAENAGWSILQAGGLSQAGTTLGLHAGAAKFTVNLFFADCSCEQTDDPFVTISPLAFYGGTELPQPETRVTVTAIPLSDGPGQLDSEHYSVVFAGPANNEVDLGDSTADAARASRYLTIASGSAPPREPRPGVWQWSSTAGGAITFEDLNAKESSDHSLFLAGVLLGIAGAAFVVLIPESELFVKTLNERRSERKKRQQEVRQAAAVEAAEPPAPQEPAAIGSDEPHAAPQDALTDASARTSVGQGTDGQLGSATKVAAMTVASLVGVAVASRGFRRRH